MPYASSLKGRGIIEQIARRAAKAGGITLPTDVCIPTPGALQAGSPGRALNALDCHAPETEPSMPLSAAFASDAPLRLRPQQEQMIAAIETAWGQGQRVAIEAPTGTGKTYAYLIAALARQERFVVSTATRALQDQLVERDIPALLAHQGQQRKVAVLKGRENYVCLHGLEQARSKLQGQHAGALAQVERWAQSTQGGDLSELDDISHMPRLVPHITASHDECLGQRCGHFERCFSNQARARAAQADILVINHHLFFSELRHRQMLGVGHGFVPLAQTMVMDEAHQLQAIGLKVLAKGLNVGDMRDYLQTVERETSVHARGFAPWQALQQQVQQAMAQWMDAEQQALGPAEAPADAAARATSRQALIHLHNALSALVAALQGVAGSAAVVAQLAGQGDGMLQALRQWAQGAAKDLVRWWDSPAVVRDGPTGDLQAYGRYAWRQGFRESPLWLWQALQALSPQVQASSWLGQGVQRWLFTSATLGDDDALTWFAQGLGLRSDSSQAGGAPLLASLRLRSHFDWAQQARLVVPRGLPGTDAQAAERAQALAQWLLPHLKTLGGRCMVLCTSTAAVQALAQALRQGLQGQAISVLQQGEQPKRRLLQAMRTAPGSKTGRVLVGTLGLWEGVDLPGQALQLLVIDKLPFPPRHDVLHAARVQALRAVGRDAFERYVLPQTAMQLRQGVGRLIRSASDEGVVVIADERLHSRSYGAALLAALPPLPSLDDAALPAFLRALAEKEIRP